MNNKLFLAILIVALWPALPRLRAQQAPDPSSISVTYATNTVEHYKHFSRAFEQGLDGTNRLDEKWATTTVVRTTTVTLMVDGKNLTTSGTQAP